MIVKQNITIDSCESRQVIVEEGCFRRCGTDQGQVVDQLIHPRGAEEQVVQTHDAVRVVALGVLCLLRKE
jgi:hypothetical protein